MMKWFKNSKPTYVEGHYSTWCAIKFVNGKVEPKLRMLNDTEGYGYFSVPADLDALLTWAKIIIKKKKD